MSRTRPIRLPRVVTHWRSGRWKAILAQETIVGHSLIIVQAVQRQIKEITGFKEQQRLSMPILRAKTRGILLALSELADEMYEAKLLQKDRFRSRIHAFRTALQSFWHSFPPELQEEIIRQSEEK